MAHRRDEIVSVIDLLISALVNIKDESGEYLLKLPDGRVIDTKGWDGWEVCVSIFLSRTALNCF
jgi:unsaturated rhamnogalacturonyl hydrolase